MSVDKNTFTSAYYSDNLDCLKYIHQNGCPYNDNIRLYRGSFECSNYFNENVFVEKKSELNDNSPKLLMS